MRAPHEPPGHEPRAGRDLSNHPAADFNGDGVLDLADQTGFVNAHSTSQGTFYNASFKYDERNQLVAFTAFEGTTRLKSSTYRYDCFNRRIASLLDTTGDGATDTETWFVYAGQAAWQLVEEYPVAVPTWSTEPDEGDHDTTVRTSYAYGNYIDEALTMRDHASGEDFFYHQDDLFSVYAITDEAGEVAERYEYGDYGQVTVLDANGAFRDPDADGHSESIYGNRHTFTGRLLDEELTLDDGSRILQYRLRYMTAGTGRLLQRDPAGFIDGMNLYGAMLQNPLTRLDPYGLCSDKESSKEKKHPNKDEDDYHARNGAYYQYTLICTGPDGKKTAKSKRGWTHDISGLMNEISSGNCCVMKFSLSTHHSPGLGVYSDPSLDVCPSDTFADKIKPCAGADIDLEMCNSCGIADRIKDNHTSIPFEVSCTDGENRHLPIDWWIWPGTGIKPPWPFDGGDKQKRKNKPVGLGGACVGC